MFIKILLMLSVYITTIKCEDFIVCAFFNHGSSYYKATFVPKTTSASLKTWDEIKEVCNDGFELVSINTTAENNAILNILQENCQDGAYAIGLSREMESDRSMASSWNWESGETVEYLYWANNNPNVDNGVRACGYMTTFENGMWSDFRCSDKFGIWIGGAYKYGYVCENITTLTAETTVYSSVTTNQLTSLSPTRPDRIDITSGLITHATNSPMKHTESCGQNEQEFDLTIVVISTVILNVIFVTVIVILLYRFRGQLFCKSKSDLETASAKTLEAANVCHVIEENSAYGFTQDVSPPVYADITE
ncbi:uncharacterized protein [Antedon mediterranea]|uniref:uncharacterized protein n=1 Tax=Antedon mediterranea TaxID=105859 RepID=UPI003AF7CFEA